MDQEIISRCVNEFEDLAPYFPKKKSPILISQFAGGYLCEDDLVELVPTSAPLDRLLMKLKFLS